ASPRPASSPTRTIRSTTPATATRINRSTPSPGCSSWGSRVRHSSTSPRLRPTRRSSGQRDAGVLSVSVYGFLRSPRWIGVGLLMTLLAAVMVGLGFWQLDRYHERSAVNDRIDAGSSVTPAPLSSVLPATGVAPSASAVWTRVTATGTYDPSHQILARARTV